MTGPRIYKVEDQFKLVFDGNPGHELFIPISEKGFEILIYVLKQQELIERKTSIATPEEPIQHMVREWLKKGNYIKKAKKIAAPETLTLDDLEISFEPETSNDG